MKIIQVFILCICPLIFCGCMTVRQESLDADFKERGQEILQSIVAQPWATTWKNATLTNFRLVAQKKDLAQPTGLPPVWHALIEGPDSKQGYLMWEQTGEGHLVEFALDDNLLVEGAIKGVPTLQQFPYQDSEGRIVASGCVPTSAASLVAYWKNRLGPKSSLPPEATPKEITIHLRQQLKIVVFPDEDGFTENGMPLAGARPSRLAKILNAEAKTLGSPLRANFRRFTIKRFHNELAEGRPALLCCTVRVPHKPELSWGHAVVGLAATIIDGVGLVGIHDNFYPSKHPETIRWIRADAFQAIIVMRPVED